MDLSHDELNRLRRDIDRAEAEAASSHRALVSGLFEDVPADQRAGALLGGMDRRGLFRVGGLTVAATAVLAACGKKKHTVQIPLSGNAPEIVPLANKPVTDVVILRTASSLELSVVDAYRKMLDNGWVQDTAIADLFKTFRDHHLSHASILAEATTAAGGTACTQLNSKITGYLVDPLIAAINESDSRSEDANAFAHALENLAASTYQSVVPVFSKPALRKAAMSVGAVEARHAAVLAMVLNPTHLVASAAAPTPTPTTAPATTVVTASSANTIVAIPDRFGTLAPIPLTVGKPNENGVRKTVNVETPSLNSFLYEDEAC